MKNDIQYWFIMCSLFITISIPQRSMPMDWKQLKDPVITWFKHHSPLDPEQYDTKWIEKFDTMQNTIDTIHDQAHKAYTRLIILNEGGKKLDQDTKPCSQPPPLGYWMALAFQENNRSLFKNPIIDPSHPYEIFDLVTSWSAQSNPVALADAATYFYLTTVKNLKKEASSWYGKNPDWSGEQALIDPEQSLNLFFKATKNIEMFFENMNGCWKAAEELEKEYKAKHPETLQPPLAHFTLEALKCPQQVMLNPHQVAQTEN